MESFKRKLSSRSEVLPVLGIRALDRHFAFLADHSAASVAGWPLRDMALRELRQRSGLSAMIRVNRASTWKLTRHRARLARSVFRHRQPRGLLVLADQRS